MFAVWPAGTLYGEPVLKILEESVSRCSLRNNSTLVYRIRPAALLHVGSYEQFNKNEHTLETSSQRACSPDYYETDSGRALPARS